MKNAIINTLPTESEEDFFLLMSLALDGLLDDVEEARFAHYLTSDRALAAEWQAWQTMHHQLNAAPHLMPTANFVDRFEANLVQQERRRLLWQGIWIAVITLLLWIGATAGILSVGTYLFVNQSTLLADGIKQIIYFWAAIATWTDSLATAFNAFAATPQAVGLGIGYLLLTMGLLAGWFNYLRRSTQLIEGTVEASSPFSIA